jgi:formylmethanofuran--tetrahydromethanopterin N-formyltransferase
MTRKLGNTEIVDTFAEAFRMVYVCVGITAHDDYWLRAAVDSFCGFATSVIACDAEIGPERWLESHETPDGRVGATCLVFGFSAEALQKSLVNRVGQCLMTCPTTMVFDGTLIAKGPYAPASDSRSGSISIGGQIRFFGDGFQKSKLIGDDRYWRIPVMEGEFVVADELQVFKGIGGGNLLIQSHDVIAGLAALRRAIDAVRAMNGGVILPFPGGGVRSGSKVGSRYHSLRASTADAHCPTLRGRVESQVHPDANCVYEMVIDGVSESAIAEAMRIAMARAAADDIPAISAGNYGGKLGKFHFHLHKLL